MTFNKNQPRNKEGKWTETGNAGVRSEVPKSTTRKILGAFKRAAFLTVAVAGFSSKKPYKKR